MEVDALGLGRRVDLDRDGDEPEDDRAVPDRAWGHVRRATHSFEEERDLLDGRAVGTRCSWRGSPRCRRPIGSSSSGIAERGAARRRSPSPAPSASSRRGRARGRRAARCRTRRRWPARPRGPGRRRRVCLALAAISVGARSSFEPLPGLASSATCLSAARAARAEHAEAPRVGQVVVRRPAGELEQLEQDRRPGRGRGRTPCACGGCGSGRRRRSRSPRRCYEPPDRGQRLGSPWSCTSWPAPLTIISFPPGARLSACRAHSTGSRGRGRR